MAAEANNTELRERYDVVDRRRRPRRPDARTAAEAGASRDVGPDRDETASGLAPEAAYKVGESTVEVSAHYFGDVLGMKDHIEKRAPAQVRAPLLLPRRRQRATSRSVSSTASPSIRPSRRYQLDRGRFENELAAQASAAGVELLEGRRVEDVELSQDGHVVRLTQDGDAARDAGPLVRRLDGPRRLPEAQARARARQRARHQRGLVPARRRPGHRGVGRPDDAEWLGRMSQPGLRRFSTNHLCGEGYWVWLIPLASGPISIGVVADPRFHPWEQINSLEGVLGLARAARAPAPRRHRRAPRPGGRTSSCSRTSPTAASRSTRPERWCLAGEAGAVPRPLLLAGIRLHRSRQHPDHRSGRPRPRRRGRERAGGCPQRLLPRATTARSCPCTRASTCSGATRR